MKVLIVDDDVFCATLAEAIVGEIEGWRSDVALDAASAMARVQTAPPDVILMDMNLGAGAYEGLALATRINAQRPCRVIFLTGHLADAGLIADVQAAVPGARLLEKPATITQLHAALTDWPH